MNLTVDKCQTSMHGFEYKNNYVKRAFYKKLEDKNSMDVVLDSLDFIKSHKNNPAKIELNATSNPPKNSEHPIIFATFNNNDAIVVDSNYPSTIDFLRACASKSTYKTV